MDKFEEIMAFVKGLKSYYGEEYVSGNCNYDYIEGKMDALKEVLDKMQSMNCENEI